MEGECTYASARTPEPGDVIDVRTDDTGVVRRVRVNTVELGREAQIVAVEI
jgi:hypothetical protein